MGVATTTDTTNSVRTSFGILKNFYGISVQVNKTTKKKKVYDLKKVLKSTQINIFNNNLDVLLLQCLK